MSYYLIVVLAYFVVGLYSMSQLPTYDLAYPARFAILILISIIWPVSLAIGIYMNLRQPPN